VGLFAKERLRALHVIASMALLCQCSPHPTYAREDEGGQPAAADAGDGGSSRSGSSSGAVAAGGRGDRPNSGGSGGLAGSAATEPTFILGADISSAQEASDRGATYVDTDGVEKGLLELLGNHGFNYVRLRAFVDPDALYGYANPNGDVQFRKAENYCDTEHTLAQALQAKQAGMRFLLDLHYSDNWADPGKQIIPAAWRGVSSVDDLAALVLKYTTDVVSAMVDGGARPDMVQIGNEITPGLLIHVPAANPNPDQWGNIDKLTNDVNGSAANVSNVATLLQAGVNGVKAVDPTIKIMLHVENTKSFPAVRSWVEQIRQRGVEFDVLGLSCYTAYQGQPAVWQDTFTQLSAVFPDIAFAIAEYNPERARANQIMRELPDGRGLGTFFWEPTQGGTWGASLFSFAGSSYTANVTDFAEIDALRPSLGL
jgi:arabinogalactan endo-1,4-beta-galactosidase